MKNNTIYITRSQYGICWCLCFLFTVVLSSMNLYAQNDREDFNTWTGLSLTYEIDKYWEISVEGQLRMEDNATVIDQYFAEVGSQYKLPSDFKIGAGLRFIRNNDHVGNIQGYENHLRFNLDFFYKHKIKKIDLKYRLRYQNKDELGISNEEGDMTKHAFRFKTTIEYNIKKWKLDPEVAAEIFNRFEKNDLSNGFNKYRLSLGTNYKLKKSGEISLTYLYEKEFNISNPLALHIIKLNYSYFLK